MSPTCFQIAEGKHLRPKGATEVLGRAKKRGTTGSVVPSAPREAPASYRHVCRHRGLFFTPASVSPPTSERWLLAAQHCDHAGGHTDEGHCHMPWPTENTGHPIMPSQHVGSSLRSTGDKGVTLPAQPAPASSWHLASIRALSVKAV